MLSNKTNREQAAPFPLVFYKTALIMVLRYISGNGFNACEELNSLLRASRGNFPQVCTVIDVTQSLTESESGGFLAIKHRWEPTDYDGLFLYMHLGIIAAINVPGSGRAQTYDVTFIGIQRLDSQADPEAGLKTFVGEMRRRRTAGTEHEWD
jgi:hypothetical protein